MEYRILQLTYCSYPTYEEWKRTSIIIYLFLVTLCSYPTYEEWKPVEEPNEEAEDESSYPTYEEWKLPKILESVTVWEVCSYPTYEEWKLPNNNIIPKAI